VLLNAAEWDLTWDAGDQARKWQYYSAVIYWKSASPWPTLRGALYDWLLQPTGGYWGARAALRGSIHVQLNFKTFVPVVVSRCPHEPDGGCAAAAAGPVEVHTRLYDLATGQQVASQRFTVPGEAPLSADAAVTLREAMLWPAAATAAHRTLLVRMQLLPAGAPWAPWAHCGEPPSLGGGTRQQPLRAEDGIEREADGVLACNQYWLRGPHEPQSYMDLGRLRLGPQEMTVTAEAVRVTEEGQLEFDVRLRSPNANTSVAVALAMHLQLLVVRRPELKAWSEARAGEEEAEQERTTDARVLWTQWSHNYITLLPGEEVRVRGGCALTALRAHAGAEEAVVAATVEGWNVRRAAVEVAALHSVLTAEGADARESILLSNE
jgi:hypothetical protein